MASPKIPTWLTYILCMVFGGAVMYAVLNPKLVEQSRQIAQLQQRMNELGKRDLPVRVGSRKALLSAGRVLMVQNLSAADLPVTAVFGRPGAPSQTRELVISANGTEQIGERQGWQFADGDSVRLSNPRYRDWANEHLVFN